MAALPEPPLVTVEEYLNTSYDPDVEYVDGVLVERPLGNRRHSLIQMWIGHLLLQKYPSLWVYSEWRAKTAETRYRIPDITVLLADPGTDYLVEPPWIAVEILSPGYSASDLIEKLKEYAQKGTPNIWVIDPKLRSIFVYRDFSLSEIKGETIATTDGSVSLTRDEIFAR